MLSKSLYLRGLQCPKNLWLYKKRPELKLTEDKKLLFEKGYEVGDLAKKLFDGGIEVEFTPDDFNGMIRKTKELLKQKNIIYEATFSENGIFAMADILERDNDGWNMYEVKSSTHVKDYHIDDASIQWYAISKAINLKKAFIIHINNKYERNGALEIDKLFEIVDITDDVLKKQNEIPKNLKKFEEVLSLEEEPEISIGNHCFNPFECDFINYCWRDIPEFSIFNLYRMSLDKKMKLYNEGIINLENVDESKLNNTQKIQVQTYKEKNIHIEQEKIKNFLNKLIYPINFLDFETFQEAIPRFNKQRPYQQIPFQYSLHILYEDGRLEHKEFLGDESKDPRNELIKNLLHDITESGTILAYNASFEKRVIKELAKFKPEYEDKLLNLLPRFEDLIEPFRNLGVYHYNFNGSFSIKSVLPALFPNDESLNYKNLGLIQNGGDAMDTYAKLHLINDEKLKEQIKRDLLKYCELDTFAMVKLLEKLKEFSN